MLVSCAQWPGFRQTTPLLTLPTPPAAFRLDGRVSVKTREESFSGGMTWRHASESQELLLRTPLGQGVAELKETVRGVELRDSAGHVHRAVDAEALVRQVLGVALPLKGLAWWVVGTARPDAPFQTEADEEGRLAVLEQDGWRIEFNRYARVGAYALPGRLVARRDDDLEVRLVVDHWEAEPGSL